MNLPAQTPRKQRKHCILPLWTRGSELSLMVSVCHLSSLGCGGGNRMFLGENVHRAMPYRSLVQVLLKHPSSHKHQRSGPGPRSPRYVHGTSPQHFHLLSTKHCDTGTEVSPRGGTQESHPLPTSSSCYLRKKMAMQRSRVKTTQTGRNQWPEVTRLGAKGLCHSSVWWGRNQGRCQEKERPWRIRNSLLGYACPGSAG